MRPLLRIGSSVLGLSLVLVSPGAGQSRPETPVATVAQRDPKWATPLTIPGVPNLNQLSPTLYRGGQPTLEGLRGLKALGVKTIVSLRAFHSENERVESVGLGHEHIRFHVWRPEDGEMRRFLGIVTDPERQPVFVHCLRGADRTGMAIATYRICIEGWTKEAAIAEMTQGGFGFHPRWKNLIQHVQEFDPGQLWPPAADPR